MARQLFQSSRTDPTPGTGTRRRSRTVLAAVGVAALLAAGATTGVPTAHSAPDPACPEAFPVAQLAEGQPVHGLTVSKGTVPSAFTGEVIGVLEDGITTDLDLVLVELQSPELTAAGGIWAGMSGSPVYAADGRLIGAVSYGLASSPTMVTGLTPAADMEALLEQSPAAAERSLAAAPGTVTLPRALARELVASGAAGTDEVAGGLARLRVPMGVSGLSARRLRQAERLQGLEGVRLFQTSAAPLAGQNGPIVPGGNVAASLSYGAFTAAYVGTVTAVCGDEVLSFGHALEHSGPTSLTMHSATALLVQPDPFWGGAYKVTNIGAPTGSMDADRFAGVHGLLGDPPAATTVTSAVTAEGRSGAGTTRITYQAYMPDFVATNMYSVQDRIFDAWGKGTGTATWTVTGTRAAGVPFSYTRSDRFASTWDISYEVPWDLYDQLWRLQNNDFEAVTIDEVTTRSDLSAGYAHYAVKSVQVRKAGVWTDLDPDKVLRLRPGTTKPVRVLLRSAQLGERAVVVDVPVPVRAAGKSGTLIITGGNSFGGGYYEGDMAGSAGDSLDDLFKEFRTTPRNDTVIADLELYRETGTPIRRQVRERVQAVVDGSFSFSVRGIRR